jgi:hypothetical protein
LKRTVITFGLISGAIISLMMAAGLIFADSIGFDKAEVLGYTTIVLSMLMVFFGVRSYRDNAAGGAITFGRAFAVGILITLISCAFYILTWEILYYNFMPGFMDKYAAYAAERAKASGAGPDAVAAQIAQIQKYKELYANPIFNAAVTFLEPFPIGLAVTLISAAILRRRRPQSQALRAPQPVDSKN